MHIVNEDVCLGVVWIVCAPFNGPVQGNGHVAPPDRISLEDDGSTDRVSCAYTYWPVYHEQCLLPVCWPVGKRD